MKSLSGLDGLFLHLETPHTPMHVGSVCLLDLPAGYRGDFFKDVTRLYARRVPLAPVLRRTLVELPLNVANPAWGETEVVELDRHIHRVTLPRPGTQRQLDACVGQLHALALDRTRPLWMVYIIDGLKSGQVAYYTKIHHAVLDGKAAVQLSRMLLDTAPRGRRFPRHSAVQASTREHPGLGEMALGAMKHDAAQYMNYMRELPAAVRRLAASPAQPAAPTATRVTTPPLFGPRTPMNVAITGARSFAGISLPLDAVKGIAAAHGATVNDVVLALCSGALRHYLKEHGALPKQTLLAGVPISLREAGNTEYTTQATMVRVGLASNIADPVKRLLAIRDATAAVKSTTGRSKGTQALDFPSIGTPWLLHGLATIFGDAKLANLISPFANLVISNVPGPPVPLYFAGARITHYWPLSIVQHGLGVNITVESYNGALGFGITAASNAVADPRSIADALRLSLKELQRRRQPVRPENRKNVTANRIASTAKTKAPTGKRKAPTGKGKASAGRRKTARS